MRQVLEEAVSGWGASLLKENELQSSRITFKEGIVSVCLCYTSLVWMLNVFK